MGANDEFDKVKEIIEARASQMREEANRFEQGMLERLERARADETAGVLRQVLQRLSVIEGKLAESDKDKTVAVDDE